MAQTIDTRPEVVDISHYAGDTLTLLVTVPVGFATGLEWKAQVKKTRDAVTADADFVITPGTDSATLVLPSAITSQLAASGVVVMVPRGAPKDGQPAPTAAVTRYTGEWDVQLSAVGGGDPVTTLAQGTLTLDLDVTDES